MRSAERHGIEAREDHWLSRYVGRPALTLHAAPNIDDSSLRRRLASEVVFATAKVPVENVAALRVLEDAGCRVVDVNLSFAIDVASLPPSGAVGVVRRARPDDREAVEDIAGRAFRYTRFHLDPVIPRTLADGVKRAWAGNFFLGARGTALLVTEDGAGVSGFLQVLERGDASVIDLIAVLPRAAGLGLGSALVTALARTPLRNGALPSRLLVGSQAANLPAVRFYEKLGFRLGAATYVLHHHGCRPHYLPEQ